VGVIGTGATGIQVIPEVAERVRNASVDLPAGAIRAEGGEILVRTTERRKVGEAFRDVTLVSRPNGTRVTLADVADIKDTFQETDRATYYNGERAISVDVYRVGDQTPLEISSAVHDFVEKQRQRGSDRISYHIWNDRSQMYEDRMNLLIENSYLGLALVLLVLGLFLQSQLAFWVTLGIPISFLGAVLFMPALGVSLNMISLFAFILTLGIVVDDAIVVGEAVFQARNEHESLLDAAIAGVREVSVPVTVAVLTTCTAFAPLLFVPGVMGKFFKHVPLIVIPIFLVSLIEVLLILPAHLAHSEPVTGGLWGKINALQQRFSEGVEEFIQGTYEPFVRGAMEYRYLTLAVSIGVLVLTVGIVGAGFLGFTFMPNVEGDRVIASVQMPFGTPVDETRKVTDRLQRTARRVAKGAKGDVTDGIIAQLGVSGAFDEGPNAGGGATGGHLTQVAVSLTDADERAISASDFAKRWRKAVGEVPGADTVDFQYNIGPSSGKAVAIELQHAETDILRRAARDLAAKVGKYRGVVDVSDGFQRGKVQYDLTLKPEARALGLTERSLAQQVRGSFFGIEADRVQRNRDELRIYVRRPEKERDSLSHLENMIVRTPQGGEIPLPQAANIEQDRSSTSIEREEGARVVDVTADVDRTVTTGNEITSSLQSDVLPGLMDRYPGLDYELSGQQQERNEALSGLATGFGFALLVMFALMAIVFNSYVQPLLIMFAIPFGFVGALAGHLLLGFELSLVSMMGLVALSGVVVNDSLVLVAAVNDFREEMDSVEEAVVAGGVRRFRPVLLTSLTTFFGLAPMIFETSVQAKFLIPMAVSLGFGVLLVTGIALVIVPAAYLALDDVARLYRRLAGSE
ncbi:MAG: efflux RND transporter permease subunit, partial [Bradymonadaceae bacterium]